MVQEDINIHIDDDRPVFVMMVGFPGSEKSKLAERIQICRDGHSSKPVVHSFNAIMQERFRGNGSRGEIKSEHQEKVIQLARHYISGDLNDGHDVIYDAANVIKKQRYHFLKELGNVDCHKVCICNMVPYDICLHNNAKDGHPIPAKEMEKMRSSWQPPHEAEGFETVLTVFNISNERLLNSYGPQSLDSLFKQLDASDQGNSHHTLTIGHHCREASAYVEANYSENKNAMLAAMMHDIGKLSTKSIGDDGQCHYYQHETVGAYDAMFYLHAAGISDKDNLHIANLIAFHMRPHVAWKQSKRSFNRGRSMLGDELFKDVMIVHEADLSARTEKYIAKLEERVDDIVHEEGAEFERE